MGRLHLSPLPETCLLVGVMSGTSADGVDVAICEFSETSGPSPSADGGAWGRLRLHHAVPYAASVRERIHSLRRSGSGRLAEIGRLTREITLAHAAAVREALRLAGVPAETVTAVADHGQTVFHDPPVTMQLLDPSLLAWEIGAGVVSDFRRADCAAGGQGAPLVPYADLRLFAHPHRTRVLLNLGGIANVTVIRPGSGAPMAFDTGPANCLSDHLCRMLAPATGGYDAGGQLASRGEVDAEVVRRFLAEAYFKAPPPKSTDGPEMVAAFERACGGLGGRRLSDLLATAVECAAGAIAGAVAEWGKLDLIASGGGTRHARLMSRIAALCPEANVSTTDQYGVPSAAKEAIAFALLGLATLRGEVGNVPSATGAARGVILGSWTPAPP